MTLHVESFAGDPAEWDGLVRRADAWTHFHLFGWKDVITGVFGHRCVYLAARRGDDLEGVLPLVRVRGPFGHYLVSMPFLNYGGPLGTPDAVRALVGRAVTEARETGVTLLELRSLVEQPIELPASHRKITVVLDVPAEGPEALWSRLKAKVRSQVRRPQKEGVTVRFGPDQVEPFYRVFAHHMRDLGTPAQSLRFFRALRDAFGDDVWFGCAYLGDRPVACGAGFRWGDEFEMTWASSLREHARIAPNMLLYWSFMERCATEGVSRFNFGRCTPGGGTHTFKRQWGGRDLPLWWYQFSQAGTVATPSPDDGALSWGPRIWKRLPVPVTTAFGPKIVRYIP